MRREQGWVIPAHPILLESLAHLAWCDGKLRDEETQFLWGVFQDLGIDEVVQKQLLSEFRPLPKDVDLLAACPDVGTRKEFLRLAADLVWSDGELCDEEWLVLRHFCRAFSLKKHTWEQLRSWLTP